VVVKEAGLKKLCVSALQKAEGLGGGKPVIKQVKVVRSSDRLDGSGVGRSKRYGFVEFGAHEHALAVLRALNNNPNVFSRDHRPIVEFALEDHRSVLPHTTLHSTALLLTVCVVAVCEQ
jgi:nucleolar protein 4